MFCCLSQFWAPEKVVFQIHKSLKTLQVQIWENSGLQSSDFGSVSSRKHWAPEKEFSFLNKPRFFQASTINHGSRWKKPWQSLVGETLTDVEECFQPSQGDAVQTKTNPGPQSNKNQNLKKAKGACSSTLKILQLN